MIIVWSPLMGSWLIVSLKELVKKIKGTVLLISGDPLCKDGNARFTTVPSKALSDQVWIRYQCFCFFNLFIVICGFLWLAHFLLIRNNGEIHRNKHSLSQKNNVFFSTFLFSLKFQGYRCKSGIAILAWRVAKNYAYSPWKKRKRYYLCKNGF